MTTCLASCHRSGWIPLLCAGGLLGLVMASSISAQLPQARIATVFPMGCQTGKTVDVTVAGSDIDEAQSLLFSHPGITGALKAGTTNQFVVTVAGNVPAGMYDVRIIGRFGVSNPRSFVVGTRPEVTETEANNSPDKAQAITIGSTINGRSDSAADIDYYKFPGKKGDRLIIECQARRIDSRLQPVLELMTNAGRRIENGSRVRHGDRMIDATLPEDGDYIVKVADFVYGGGSDFFYRLTLSKGPWVDFVLPASGLPGTEFEATVYGRALPGGQKSTLKLDGKLLETVKVKVKVPADGASLAPADVVGSNAASIDGFSYTISGPQGVSSPIQLYFSKSPSVVEVEPNDDRKKPQKITVPVEITGQFNQKEDVDIFEFEAKSGEVFWMDVFGHRNGSAADPRLVVEQVKGETATTMTTADDSGPNLGGVAFETNHFDPTYKFTAPADGTYRIVLRDLYYNGHPTMLYRLAVRKEQPDFRLVAYTQSPTTQQNQVVDAWELGMRRGGSNAITVLALKQDGFTGPIELVAEGLPAGVTVSPAVIGPTQNSAVMVFHTTEDSSSWAGFVKITGRALVDDAAAVKAANDARTALAAAATALADADKKLAAAKEADKAAAETAQKEAAAKLKAAEAALQAAVEAQGKKATTLVREARGGTILYKSGQQNRPAEARVARNVAMAVHRDIAPYQAEFPAMPKFEVPVGGAAFVPMKLTRRDGFDKDVTVAFSGLPQNITSENKTYTKAAAENVFKVTVANNVAPGTYTLLLQGQAQLSFVRLPDAVEKAKKEKEAADKLAADVDAKKKKADADKADADKKATAAADAVKKAMTAKTAADKAHADAVEAEKKATDKGPAAEAVKKAASAKEAADKALADAQMAAKQATDTKTAADAAAAAIGKQFADADAAKKAADKKVTDATNASKPANLAVNQPLGGVVVAVRPLAGTLTATADKGGAVKKGETVEVKVAVKRGKDVMGPLQVSLVVPGDVKGVSSEALTIPAGQDAGTLKVKVDGATSAKGAIANAVVRVSGELNGTPALADAPVTLNVQ